jgi:hypothetical protein
LKQTELEWTTIAYLEYISPISRTWSNKFGESFSFDDLAAQLCERDLARLSCGGLHGVTALSAILKADRSRHILSRDMRLAVEDRLRTLVRLALEKQLKDGSWAPGWTMNADAPPDVVARYVQNHMNVTANVLCTGHTYDWLVSLEGSELLEGQHVHLQSALAWLSLKVNESTLDQRWNNFCPWAHAVQCTRTNNSRIGL